MSYVKSNVFENTFENNDWIWEQRVNVEHDSQEVVGITLN